MIWNTKDAEMLLRDLQHFKLFVENDFFYPTKILWKETVMLWSGTEWGKSYFHSLFPSHRRSSIMENQLQTTNSNHPSSGGFTFSVNKPILQNKSPPGRYCYFFPSSYSSSPWTLLIIIFLVLLNHHSKGWIKWSICKLLSLTSHHCWSSSWLSLFFHSHMHSGQWQTGGVWWALFLRRRQVCLLERNLVAGCWKPCLASSELLWWLAWSAIRPLGACFGITNVCIWRQRPGWNGL